MKIIPTQNFVLVRMHDIPVDADLELPDDFRNEPYGEVIAHGPDCKVVKCGDFILFDPQNFIRGFDKNTDPRFIIGEGCVYATCDPTTTQSGAEELKIVKNPPEQP